MNQFPDHLRPSPGSITIEHEAGGLRVLCLSGDVDSATVAEYENRQGRVRAVVDVIDAGGVTFLGSAGLALMLRCAEAAAEVGPLPVLRAPSDPVERLLHLAGVSNFFRRAETGSLSTSDESPSTSG